MIEDLAGRDVVFIGYPGGNTGDDLIAQGCLRFLRDAGLDVVPSNATLDEAIGRGDTRAVAAALGSFGGVVVFSGGGNIGIYPDNEARRCTVMVNTPEARAYLVMPQSCAGPEEALRDERVEVWARESQSLEILRAAGVRTQLAPDAAFAMADRFPTESDGKGVLVILRTPGTCDERMDHAFAAPGAVSDPTLDLAIDGVVDAIAPRAVVVSDRLHGAIIASMMRKRVALLPVSYHKNRSFYQTWFATDPGVEYVEDQTGLRRFLESETRSTTNHRELFLERAEPALRRFLDRVALSR
jgi:exopolysaccharide biosynthesis predicted pyruvyltransferase EpsI